MQFLTGIKELNKSQLVVDYFFISDNKDKRVASMLEKLNRANKKMQFKVVEADLASNKKLIAQYAKKHQYDYLFMINCDLVIYPDTLHHLIALKKDVISEIFYSKCANQLLPIKYVYNKFRQPIEQIKSSELRLFIQRLKATNLIESNVAGDCTLYSKKVVQSGISFKLLDGELEEGYHSVVSNEYSIYTDTRMPAFHIQMDADIYHASQYLKDYQLRKLVVEKDKMIQKLISKERQVCYPAVLAINLEEQVGKMEYFSGVTRNWYELELKRINNNWDITKTFKKKQQKSYKKQVRSNMKKITLIFNRRSGSDTIALYKAMPENIKVNYEVNLLKENINSQQYYTEIQASDILVLTDANFILDKNQYNPDQMIINLWHGFPLKAMFFQDVNAVNNGEWSKFWKQFDLMTSYSTLYNELIHKSMRIDPQRFVITGQPRNDYLFNGESRTALYRLLQCKDENKKLIFYMPTFRVAREVSGTEGNRNWDNPFGFSTFNEDELQTFMRDYDLEVIVKLHPNEEARYKDFFERLPGFHLITEAALEKENMHSYEVLGAADLLITDYSSVYFDYLLLNKPIVFTPIDLEEYRNSRGFLLEPYEDWTPGPKASTQLELQREIIRSLEDSAYYGEKREKIKDVVHHFQDNKSCERVWQLISSNLK